MGNSAKVDQKGRLKIPGTLLTMLKGPGTEFYVTSEDGSSARIYLMQVWNQIEERLERLCSDNRNNQKLLVRAKYFGEAVTMDKQGRVLIPIVLRSSAQMRGAVDVLDYGNYLEVWNHARFVKNLKSSPITAQDEKTLNKLSSTPRFPWAAHRNKEERHVHRTERRFRVHRRIRSNSRGHANHAIRGAGTDSAGHAPAA
jgi:MraZ protein